MNTSSADARPVSDEMQDAVERLRSTINTVASDPAPGNDILLDLEPGLFRAFARQRGGRDAVGISWERHLPPRFGYRLASVHRKLSGIDGLSSLLLADFETQQEGDEAGQLSLMLRESLMMALTELVSSARETMCWVSDDLGEMDLQARIARDGAE